MLKFYTSSIFLILSISTSYCQEFLEITTGPGYQSQQYIRLSNNETKSVKHDSWDIAFTSFGTQDAGVHVNEAGGTSMGQPQPEVEVYDTKSTDFSKVFILDSIKNNRLYNEEKTWSYGAFNSTRGTSPFDYGWGKYTQGSQKVIGEKVFVIKLRNGKLLKFRIDDLNGFTYNFTYANLDGTGLTSKSVTKTTGTQKLIYFNLTTGNTVDVQPTTPYDLIYTRYTSIAQDPNGPTVAQYNVTGVLAAPGTFSAEVSSDDFDSAPVPGAAEYIKQYDVIGYDWKTFTANQWQLDEKKIFYLQTSYGDIYKFKFIDFQGAATGNATLQKAKLGPTSYVNDETLTSVHVFPNPSSDRIEIVYAAKNTGSAVVSLLDINGKIVKTTQQDILSGLNVVQMSISDLPQSNYTTVMYVNGRVVMSQNIVKI
jgi:hypothetical protein